jgi:membrane protein implicated in regulation of membrane protease activity
MDNPALWAGIFLAVAVGFGIGEIVLASSFFLLPFAIGALVASIVSLMGAGPVISFPLFLIVSFCVFLGFRPLAKRLDADTPDVAGIGANRLIGVTGSVTEAIPPNPGEAGMVRIGGEDWRADAADDLALPVGLRVRVLEVRGTRLVVEPLEPPYHSPQSLPEHS